MAIRTPALVQETSITTGTGTYDLSGSAPTNRRTFAQAIADGALADLDTVPYVVFETGSPPSFERGYGVVTVGSPYTLSRAVILESSNGGSAVNWGVGTRDVWIELPQPAEKPVRTLVHLTSLKTVTASSGYLISWDAEVEDTAGAWAVSPNPTRITVPSTYTRIRLTGNLFWNSNGVVGQVQADIFKNGGIFTNGPIATTYMTATEQAGLNILSPPLVVTATDYFELRGFNISGTNRDLLATDNATWFSAEFWRE